jgi:hypothetical protein
VDQKYFIQADSKKQGPLENSGNLTAYLFLIVKLEYGNFNKWFKSLIAFLIL